MEERIEYKILADIKFKEKNFYVISNKRYQKFFIRIMEDNSLMYPTLDEFMELDKIFNEKPEDSIYLLSIKNNSEEKKLKIGTRFRIIPKVIYNGALISLASALLLSGCREVIDTNEIVSIESQQSDRLDKKILESENEDCIIKQSMMIKSVVLNIEDDKSVPRIITIGRGIEEGKADIIASIAGNSKLSEVSKYDEEAEQLRIFLESNTMEISDIMEYGSYSLIEKMSENDVNFPISYIENVDVLSKAHKNSEHRK